MVMKLSTKVRYGMRAMIYLAIYGRENPVLAQSIADNLNMSKKYLESLLISLKNAELIRSVRGYKGGYILAKNPKNITALNIVNALDGSLSLIDCVPEPSLCEKAEICTARELWEQLTNAMTELLKSHTLESLAQAEMRKNKPAVMYYI